jgi:hypothetical protein
MGTCSLGLLIYGLSNEVWALWSSVFFTMFYWFISRIPVYELCCIMNEVSIQNKNFPRGQELFDSIIKHDIIYIYIYINLEIFWSNFLFILSLKLILWKLLLSNLMDLIDSKTIRLTDEKNLRIKLTKTKLPVPTLFLFQV